MIALMHARGHAWCLRATVPAALRLADAVVVGFDGGDAATAEALEELARPFPDRVVVRAAAPGADPVAPLLAAGRSLGEPLFMCLAGDEVVTGNLPHVVRESAKALSPGHGLWMPEIDLWDSLDRFRCISEPKGPMCARVFRDAEGVQLAASDQRPEGSAPAPRLTGATHPLTPDSRFGGMLRLTGASAVRRAAERAHRKMTAALMAEGVRANRTINSRIGAEPRAVRTTRCPAEWWGLYTDVRAGIALDGECWDASECRRLLNAHGEARFRGLDLGRIFETRAGVAARPSRAAEPARAA